MCARRSHSSCDAGGRHRRASPRCRAARRRRAPRRRRRSAARLPQQELRGGDVDRTCLLQRADGVDAAGREVAERQGERAHDPQPLGEPGERHRLVSDSTGHGCLEREHLDRVLRRISPRRLARSATRPRLASPSTPRPSRSRGRSRRRRPPSSRPRRRRSRPRRTGSPASRSASRRWGRRRHASWATRRTRSPSSSETRWKSSPSSACSRSSRTTIAPSAAASTAVVSSPPSPSPITGSRSSRVGIAREDPAQILDRATTEPEPRRGHGSSGWKSRPETSFGIEVRALLRHRLAAAGDREHVLDPSRPHQHGDLRLTLSTARTASCQSAVYVRPSWPRRSTSRTSSWPVAVESEFGRPAVDDGRGSIAGELSRARASAPRDSVVRRAPAVACDACGRRGAWGRSSARDRRRLTSTTIMYPLSGVPLLVVRERGLVAVVPVGDQEPPVGEGLAERSSSVEPPEPGALDLDLRIAAGDLERRVAFVEEEDRLELGARLAQQAESPLLRPAVRSLVGQDGARLVRLDPQRPDQARPRAGDPVRADVVLGQRPERPARSGTRTPSLAPLAEARGRPPPPSRAASGGRRCTGSCSR